MDVDTQVVHDSARPSVTWTGAAQAPPDAVSDQSR